MERSDIAELHFIARVENLASILRDGVLSHERADAIAHVSFAMADVQAKRATVRVPDGSRSGRPLHTYANLYIHARNVTMWARRSDHENLGVVCIDPAVLDIDGAVITDGNAGSLAYTRFAAAPEGLGILDKERVFTDDWRDPDPFTYKRQRRLRCAGPCSPHVLRHTFARSFLANGGDVFSLQRILGHSPASLDVTRRYVQLLDEDLRETHRRASPVDRLNAPKLGQGRAQ